MADEYLVIPWQQLSEDALLGVMEEFINREGTDYGELEYSLEQKVRQIRRQLEQGRLQLVFDDVTQTTTLIEV